MRVGRRIRNGENVPFLISSAGKLIDWDSLATDTGVAGLIRRTMESGDDADLLEALDPLEKYLEVHPNVVAEAESKSGVHLGDEDVLAPPVRPRNFLCVGLNYRDHASESKMDIPVRPLFFAKTSNSITGSGHPVRVPRGSVQLDFEAELAVVIGKRCREVKVSDALDYVAGYTCVNDLSARDFQFADGQWYRGKSCDGFGPIGPCISTKAEVVDSRALGIRCRLNGTTMQDSNTANLIFGVAELIAHISAVITLEPGDVIATGTPPGVGFARKPPVYLHAGDVIEVEVDKIGVLRNVIEDGANA